MLDAYAGTDLGPVLALRAELRRLAEAVESLGGDAQQRAREADVLRYQVNEIASAHLADAGEEDELRQEEVRLADASAHREAAAHAGELLEDPPASGAGSGTAADGGVLAQLAEAVGALSGREAFDEYRERIAGAAIDLSDVARGLRDVVEGWEDDPDRLVAVQERRRLLADLRRKYGVDLTAVLAFAKEAATRLDELDNAEETAERLEAEQIEVAQRLEAAEKKVRDVRTRAATKFGALVGERLADLAMPGARVEIRVAHRGRG